MAIKKDDSKPDSNAPEIGPRADIAAALRAVLALIEVVARLHPNSMLPASWLGQHRIAHELVTRLENG